VFENRVLRKILWSKWDEVTGQWKKKLHNDELYDLSSSLNIIQMIISRRMKWVGHVAHMGTGELYVWFWWINLRERTRLEDLGVNGRIIKKCIFKKWD
jgi:hypothetical protein